MKLEVELKAPADLDEARRRLKELGALLLVEDEEQLDVYLQHPCRDFASTDEALRLRKRGEGAFLTYKGPKAGGRCKARLEVEVAVSSFEDALELLKQLGFEQVAVLRKRRSMYKVRGFQVYLDEVEGLGCFMEIESLLEPSSAASVEEEALRLARLLGARVEEATTKSYLEMFLERWRDVKGRPT